MEHTDDYIPTASVKIEQPRDQEKVGLVYLVLLFLSFFFILMTHILLSLEGIGKALPAFLRLSIG